MLWAAFAFLAIDRALKAVALSGASLRLFRGVEFALFKNPGIAFSLPLPNFVFWPNAALILSALVWLCLRMRKHDAVGAALLVCVILGSLSNIIDRAIYSAVIDYLIFFGRSAVNVADGMIVGGVLALIFRPKQIS
jgi:lipoprotein signal peptidase